MTEKQAFLWKPFLLALFSMLVLGYGAGLIYNHFAGPSAPEALFEGEASSTQEQLSAPSSEDTESLWQDEDSM